MNATKSTIAVIVGILVGLIAPISIKIVMITHGSVNLLPAVYFLGKAIPFFAIGYLLTDFIIFFFAGLLVSLISKQTGVKLLLIVGIVTPLLATALTFRGSFDLIAFLINFALAIVYVLIGGKVYQKVFNKNA